MRPGPVLVWLQRDLRLADNPALSEAAERGTPVIPIFVWSPEGNGRWAPGSASRWWLHQSLEQLCASLRKRGSTLTVRRGPARRALLDVAAETGAASLYWNEADDPAARAQVAEVEKAVCRPVLEVRKFPGNLLWAPGSIRNSSGRPFTVFTAFWNVCRKSAPPPEPLNPPRSLRAPARWPKSIALSDLGLEPTPDWAGGIRSVWHPGEPRARNRLRAFLDRSLAGYSEGRDRPAQDGVSRMSPYLHFGEISARQVWHAAHRHGPNAEPFLRQIAWREFAHHLLFHFPETAQEPLRPEFRNFPWCFNAKAMRAWTRGQTGYPLVDAGMRQLWQTGWMHNRVRMVVASFLVKHLLMPWQEGAAWFWDTLVDADLANNTLGWQWAAGCGADAAPYFRIFNPTLQGEKFDPDGAYVRSWVPELAKLSARWIHKPWQAPASALAEARITLGRTYPFPIVDHEAARKRALEAWGRMRQR